ncbi:MAG: response regulator [Nostocales cyanobacterium]|nr:MAG: response regulator [Nostocales cyanobacterium]
MNIHPQDNLQSTYKVLIVEDSLADFELYQRFLQKDELYRYTILYAETAEEGLEIFVNDNPDIVLVDFSLPDMDGIELIAAMQKVEKSKEIPIMMMTGQGNEAIALAAMKKNIQDYLIKGELNYHNFINAIYHIITIVNSQNTAPESKNINLLLVDNSDVDLEIYTKFIHQDKDFIFNIQTATTAKDALFLLKNHKFDILITDYLLPDMNGIDMIDIYNKSSNSESTCIILMTGNGNEQLVVQAMKKGVSDYIVKQNMTGEKLCNLVKDNFYKHRLSTQVKKIQYQKTLLAKISDNIRSSLDLQKVIESSVIEVKRYFNADRVVIYKLDESGNGKVLGEAVNHPFTKLINLDITDTFFQNYQNIQEYVNNCRKQVVSDVKKVKISPCHRQLLEQFQVKSVAAIPLIISNLSNTMWGLLIVHFCQIPHIWEQHEISFLTEIAGQISIAIQQSLLFEELKIERDRANAATQAKSMFLANMSHEIRTPMNGILGMAEILALSNLSPEQRDYIQTIQSSAKNLLNIINDILDLSKLESGNIKLEKSEFFLQNMIAEIIKIFCISLTQKDLQLDIDIAPDIPDKYLGDPHRLRQILVNLLGNAVKFTSQGKIKITIHKYQTQDKMKSKEIELYFSIEDSGIGISKEDQKNLFQPFSQVENTTTRNFAGTGLGLSICKKLVELMAGKIGVNSTLHCGSNFWFTAKLEFVDEVNDTLSVISSISQQENNDHQSVLIKSEKILVAEDNKVNQKVISNQLKRIGYECDIVDNGQAVIDKLQEKSYHLILMDCQMPILDGYDATYQIRHQEITKNLIIIGLSAFAMKDDKQKCLDAGMNDYLSKPCSIPELEKMIQKWLHSQ